MLKNALIFVFLVVISSFSYGSSQSFFSELNTQRWNSNGIELISLILPKNPIILELGTECGNQTRSIAQYWSHGRILAFEPNSRSFELLAKRVDGLENLQIISAVPLLSNDFENGELFQTAPSKEPPQDRFIHLRPSSKCETCTTIELCTNQIDLLILNIKKSGIKFLESACQTLTPITCIAIPSKANTFADFNVENPEYKSILEEKFFFQFITPLSGQKSNRYAIFINKDFFFNHDTQKFLSSHQIDREYKRYYEPFFRTCYDLNDQFSDSLKDTLKQGLPYEGNIGIMMEQLVRKGSVVIDVGAHVGVHTVTLSRKVGPDGIIIAFEPKKRLYLELLNTLNINQCQNVLPIAKGLSDCQETVLLQGIHIVQDSNEQLNKDVELIDLIELDSMNLTGVSLIKMDIEQYEYFAFKGAKETILRNKPIIFFECWINPDYYSSSYEQRSNFDRVISLVESFDYEIYVIFNNDFIAFPREAINNYLDLKKKLIKLDMNNFYLGL